MREYLIQCLDKVRDTQRYSIVNKQWLGKKGDLILWWFQYCGGFCALKITRSRVFSCVFQESNDYESRFGLVLIIKSTWWMDYITFDTQSLHFKNEGVFKVKLDTTALSW